MTLPRSGAAPPVAERHLLIAYGEHFRIEHSTVSHAFSTRLIPIFMNAPSSASGTRGVGARWVVAVSPAGWVAVSDADPAVRERGPAPHTVSVGVCQRVAIRMPRGSMMSDAVRCRILGPVRIEVDGQPIPLPRRRVRHLLAVLLLEVGHPLPTTRLIDLLWPDDEPPANARTVLQNTVSRLRATLGAADGIELVRRGDGYAIETDPDTVDAYRFRRLVERADRAPDPSTRGDLARRALSLWRGPALADVGIGAARNPTCLGLDEIRQQALDLRIRADLDLGRHEALIGELTELVTAEPLNERVVGQLVLALYRSGRRSDALAACQRARTQLADQLGLDPGPELRRLELAMLRADPDIEPPDTDRPDTGPDADPPGSVPPVARAGAAAAGDGDTDRAKTPVSAQLPPAVAAFTGRAPQLRELDRAARDAGETVPIVVICGLAGVGKTALAVHWAHAARTSYPHGQLYVDLRGYALDPPVPPIVAVGALLRGLGVSPGDIPADAAEATALFRSTVADRRILVLLDNARDPGQVRALLPGGAGCMVLVTSRDRLSGLLAIDGARQLPLDVLPPAESLTLLRRTLGTRRVDAEPEAAAALTRACGHLPLALRIAAANLSDRPHRSIADQVRELGTTAGLAALEVDGDLKASTRAAFDLSYRALSGPARRLFGLLALAPGPDLSVAGAAALAAVDAAQADRLLHRLHTAHLVRRAEPLRYAMHDLVRRYAADVVARERPTAERAAATERLFHFYLDTTDAAVALLCPQVVRMPLRRSTGTRLSFADHADAHAWLQLERPNLVATVHYASEHGPAPVAWLLADRLRGYFWISRQMADWLASSEAGLATATTHRDLPGQAACHLSLGIAQRSLGRHRSAAEHLGRALELSRRTGWLEGQAAALGSLGIAHAETGRNRDAVAHFTEALALNRRMGRRAGEAIVLGNLGNLRGDLGELRQAARDLTAALRIYRDVPSPGGEAIALSTRGLMYLHLGRLDAAEADLARSRALHDEIDDRYGLPFALAALGAVHDAGGRPAQARECTQLALDIADQTGDRRAEAAALTVLGDIALGSDGAAEAISHYERALRTARAHGYRFEEYGARVRLADAHLHAADPERALAEAKAVRELSRRWGYAMIEDLAVTVMAGACLARGAVTDAARYASAAMASHRRTGCRRGEAAARTVWERARA
jgi:DNA-binding SARP family transcriptional activator/tetratricopeptide (TPR) repeat protein